MKQTRPSRFWVRSGLKSAWQDNFAAQVRLLAFSNCVCIFVWTGKMTWKCYWVDRNIVENGEKYLHFQTKTDTRGQGLNFPLASMVQFVGLGFRHPSFLLSSNNCRTFSWYIFKFLIQTLQWCINVNLVEWLYLNVIENV